MTDNTGTPPTTVRWEDPDGSWWIISWDPDHSRYDATKFTHGDTGEERIVDDVGFGDRRITTVEELAAQMNRTLPTEVIHDLQTAASAPNQLATTPVAEATERPMGARYRIDKGDGTWWELGWDKPLGTFYATRFLDDGAPGHRVVEDYGNGISEIGTIAGLGDVIGRAIPPPISHELAADAAAHPFTVTPRFLPSDPMVVITPDPSDGSARAAELARWEARLRAQQAELEAFAASLTGQNRVEPLWALPSEPVTLALHMLNREVGGESDVATFHLFPTDQLIMVRAATTEHRLPTGDLMRRPSVISLAAGFAALALLTAACADSDSGGTVAAGDEPASTTKSVSNDWALDYTGGTEGEADDSLEPIVIGYVNQEGGVPAFPEATVGTEAAVEYINGELGGIGGHPLELKTCLVQAEEDGQKCGTEMVNDPSVQAVLTGVLVTGSDSLYKVIGDKLPVIVGNPVSNPDFLAPGLVAFTPGSPGVIQGLAVFIATQLSTADEPIEKVAIVHGDNDGAKTAVSVLFTPALNQLGITDIKAVPVPETATAPDLQAALQAAGAADADVLVPLTTTPLCIATYDALKALGIDPTVVSPGLCYGTAMTAHLEDVGDGGQAPDGWYFGGYGYSYFMPDEESGMETYIAKIREYGGADVEYTGFSGPQFANVMTIAKFLNAVGADNVSGDAIQSQVDSFTGPMMITAGPMTCGEVSPIFPTLCGSEMGIEQYADGEWTSIANALNGKAINPTEALASS